MRELIVGRFCRNSLYDEGVAAVERSTGKLWCYPSSNGVLGSRKEIGSGWNGMGLLTTGEFTMNGIDNVFCDDVIAVDRSTGIAWLYPGKDGGGFGARVKVADNWSGYAQMVGGGDFNGDGPHDLIAIDKAGVKWLLAGSGNGKFATRVQLS